SALRREEESYNEAIDTMQVRTDNKGKTFGIWKAWGRISITAGKILRETDKFDYLICLQNSPENWGKVSLRSIEERFVVTSLAGIGGHLSAGGGMLTEKEADTLFSSNYCLKYSEDWEDGTSIIEECKF
ncbi:MAG: hypothetical protein ACRCZZ_07460, partial [Phocaeicola sp.]